MKRKYLTFSLILAGAVLIGAGICFGQPGAVFNKAVRICLECVGIG
jgi:hypothetical protein